MNIRKILLRLFGTILFLPLALFFMVIACDIVISDSSSEKLYDNIDSIPKNKVCVVLGTTPYRKGYPGGNPYFNYRIEAAAQLYKKGAVKQIIVSGDSSKNYDETTKMRDALVKRGVPRKAITRDTKGQSTIASIERLKEHFKLEKFTIVSQQFQNERAIFLAKHLGLDAIGYNAKDINVKKGYRVYFREKLARVKVFIDILRK